MPHVNNNYLKRNELLKRECSGRERQKAVKDEEPKGVTQSKTVSGH